MNEQMKRIILANDIFLGLDKYNTSTARLHDVLHSLFHLTKDNRFLHLKEMEIKTTNDFNHMFEKTRDLLLQVNSQFL